MAVPQHTSDTLFRAAENLRSLSDATSVRQVLFGCEGLRDLLLARLSMAALALEHTFPAVVEADSQ